eukprot:COSAG02_NODE_1008_length_15238_cov_24.345928_6_plen_109_part_00
MPVLLDSRVLVVEAGASISTGCTHEQSLPQSSSACMAQAEQAPLVHVVLGLESVTTAAARIPDGCSLAGSVAKWEGCAGLSIVRAIVTAHNLNDNGEVAPLLRPALEL